MVGGEPRAVTISSARERVCVCSLDEKGLEAHIRGPPVLREDGVNDLVTPHPWLPSRQGKAEQSSGGDPELMCQAPAASVSPRAPSLAALFQDRTEERGCQGPAWPIAEGAQECGWERMGLSEKKQQGQREGPGSTGEYPSKEPGPATLGLP